MRVVLLIRFVMIVIFEKMVLGIFLVLRDVISKNMEFNVEIIVLF